MEIDDLFQRFNGREKATNYINLRKAYPVNTTHPYTAKMHQFTNGASGLQSQFTTPNLMK